MQLAVGSEGTSKISKSVLIMQQLINYATTD